MRIRRREFCLCDIGNLHIDRAKVSKNNVPLGVLKSGQMVPNSADEHLLPISLTSLKSTRLNFFFQIPCTSPY